MHFNSIETFSNTDLMSLLTFGLFILLVKILIVKLLDEDGVGGDHGDDDEHHGRLDYLADQFPTVAVIFCFTTKHCLERKIIELTRQGKTFF